MPCRLGRACALLATPTAIAAVAASAVSAQAVSLPGAVSSVTNTASGAVSSVATTASRAVSSVAGPLPQPPPAPQPVQQIVHTVTSTLGQTLSSVPKSSGSGGGGAQQSGAGTGPTAQGGGGGSAGGTHVAGPTAGAAAGGGGPQGTSSRSSGGSGGSGGGQGGSRARHSSARTSATHGGGGAAAGARASGPHAPAGSTSGRDPALVRDIRTIVRVIPDPVKGLIAALFLLALGFAIRSRVISRRARRLERQRRELLGDLGLLQRALLPELPTDLRALDVSVAYRPAEGPAAGGDFYDVFALDERRTAIIVGDVMGHGREALAVTALMRYTLRAYLNAGFEPRVALKVAGGALAGDPDGELTTVVVAVHDASSGTLTYACAGHEPPIIAGPGAHDPVTFWSAPPLGGFMETGQRQTTISLTRDSRVCLFTDGLVEARVGDGLMGRKVLTTLFADVGGAEQLLDRVAATAEHTRDDMAACVVTPLVSASGSLDRRIEELELSGDELRAERLEAFLAACSLAPGAIRAAVERARAMISAGDGAIVRVTVEDGIAVARLLPRDRGPVAIPPVDEARRYARLAATA